MVIIFKLRGGVEGGGKGYLGCETTAFTLSTSQDQTLFQQMEQPIILDDQGGSVMTVTDSGVVGTLRAQTHQHEPIAKGSDSPLLVEAPSYSIQGNIIGRQVHNGGNGSGIAEEEAGTLTKVDRHGVCHQTGNERCADTLVKGANQTTGRPGDIAQMGTLVRRLTPLECERLQGFPDNFTNIPGASDAKRYAALGNSMTVNVMHWIGSRINAVQDIMDEIEK